MSDDIVTVGNIPLKAVDAGDGIRLLGVSGLTGVDLGPATLIVGGDMEDPDAVAGLWLAGHGSEQIEFDTVDPINGMVSLKCTTGNSFSHEGIFYSGEGEGGVVDVVPESTYTVTYWIKGTQDMSIDLAVFWDGSDLEVLETTVLSDTPVEVELDLIIPSDVESVQFNFWTSGDDPVPAGSFWIDDFEVVIVAE